MEPHPYYQPHEYMMRQKQVMDHSIQMREMKDRMSLVDPIRANQMANDPTLQLPEWNSTSQYENPHCFQQTVLAHQNLQMRKQEIETEIRIKEQQNFSLLKDLNPDPPMISNTLLKDLNPDPPMISNTLLKDWEPDPPMISNTLLKDWEPDPPMISNTLLKDWEPDPPMISNTLLKDWEPDPPMISNTLLEDSDAIYIFDPPKKNSLGHHPDRCHDRPGDQVDWIVHQAIHNFGEKPALEELGIRQDAFDKAWGNAYEPKNLPPRRQYNNIRGKIY